MIMNKFGSDNMKAKLLKEIASYLGETDDLNKVNNIEKLESNPSFFLTFWGHFSAGKSSLINSILSRDILPIQNRESTATLTYIRYGDDEKCTIFYDNGNNISVDVKEVKYIFQNSDEKYNVSEIDHLDIELNNDLLGTGLVIVDTPGINTLIKKHEELALDAIGQSGRIVYVLGGSPTAVDCEFIKNISDNGIEISFVRTKVDQINPQEEDVEKALNDDKEKLKEMLNHDIHFIAVSNEKDNIYFRNIKFVQDELKRITRQIDIEMENAINNRIDIFKKKYYNELQVKQDDINNLLNGEEEQINEKIESYKHNLKQLEIMNNQSVERINVEFEQACAVVKDDLKSYIENSIKSFEKKANKLENSKTIKNDLPILYEKSIKSASIRANTLIEDSLDGIIIKETTAMSDIVNNALGNVNDFSAPTYVEMKRDNQHEVDAYKSRIEEAEEKLELMKENYDKNKNELSKVGLPLDDQTYQDRIRELQKLEAEITDAVQMKRIDSNKGAKIGRRIGDAVDLALLLIPGEAIAAGIKGAADTTQLAQKLHKAGDAGKVVLNTLGVAEKTAGPVDKVRDFAYLIKSTLTKGNYSTVAERKVAAELIENGANKVGEIYENQKTNPLEFITAAYWFEKIGKSFDKPKYVIDVDAENERQRRIQQCKKERQEVIESRLQRKKQLGLYKNKIQEEEARIREQANLVLELENKEKEIEEQVQRESQIKSAKKYISSYIVYFTKTLQEIIRQMQEYYFNDAKENIILASNMRNAHLIKAIEQKKQQLEKLIEDKEKGNISLTSDLEIVKKYLDKLEG